MKRIIILVAVGLLSFLVGTAGIYLAMPSLAPHTVDSTRVRLDSLGLLATTSIAPSAAPDASLPDTLQPSSTDSTSADAALPKPQDIIQRLQDSLNTTANIIQSLASDTSTLSGEIAELQAQLDERTDKQAEVDGLSQSLSKLEDRQLGNILAGLDLPVIEMLYEQASARERTRLLQSMTPDQAARFVRTLVKGPEAIQEQKAEEGPDPGEETDDEANQTAN